MASPDCDTETEEMLGLAGEELALLEFPCGPMFILDPFGEFSRL